MDGNGNMIIDGIVFIDDINGDGDFEMKEFEDLKTIRYTGSASIYASGDVEINLNLLSA